MKRTRVAVSVACALAATCGVAQAEEGIEEIVVTARGIEESVRDIPVALTVMDESRLKNLDLQSFEDVAATMPQLNIVRGNSGSGASINIRGIGSNSTSIGIEQSVAVILDGVYYTQGRVINEGLFDVKQVAVMKGPQALFFGKNATAGVISIETNNPGDELEIIGRVAYESTQERKTYEAVISSPITDTFGARLAIQKRDADDGYMKNSAGVTFYNTLDAATLTPSSLRNEAPANDFWSGEQAEYARLTLAWDPSDQVSINLKGFYSTYELNSPTGSSELWNCPALNGVASRVAGGVPVPNTEAECRADRNKAENPVPSAIANSNPLMNNFGGELGEDYESFGGTLTADFTFEKVNLTGIINYHDQETNWVGDYDGGGSTSTFAGENNTFDAFSAELRAVTTLDSPVNFVGGLYYQSTNRTFDQDVLFAGAENSAAPDPTNRFTAYEKNSETEGETWSVYGEVVWDITDRWQLTAGARYIDEEKKSYYDQPYVNPFFTFLFTQGRIATTQKFDDLVPEITLRYEITDDVTVYAAYKEGFKSGGFSNSGILGAISGNISDFTFNPEKVDGFEAGIKAALLDGTMNVEFEVYTYDFKDLQIDFFNSPVFAFVTENAGGSKTDGAELQVTWAPAQVDGLTLRSSVAYNIGEYTDFLAPCWAGQTPAQGCTIFNPGQVPKQQLGGQVRSLAPKWSGALGLDYDIAVGGNMMIGFTANYQFKSRHQLNGFGNPHDFQKAYQTLDAAIRLYSEDLKWQVAFIARNLTDEYALLSSGDTPGTGGGTGTANGFPADRSGSPIVGDTYELELTVRF
ncbi:MAG: TonB-dependent receptor [Pseudomonadales bacterium]|nr:TonB-dependent receptor [Pseudomonadales bacterium]